VIIFQPLFFFRVVRGFAKTAVFSVANYRRDGFVSS